MSRMDKQPELVQKLKEAFRSDVLEVSEFKGEITAVIDKGAVVRVLGFLKNDPDFRMNYLVDVLGVDYMPRSPRFEVVYHLYSVQKKHRIRVKARVGENETIPSATALWGSADWAEREAYDMFGIIFEGHPGLKRIYLADDWEGFPLRKDYPLRGYKDRYNPFGEDKE